MVRDVLAQLALQCVVGDLPCGSLLTLFHCVVQACVSYNASMFFNFKSTSDKFPSFTASLVGVYQDGLSTNDNIDCLGFTNSAVAQKMLSLMPGALGRVHSKSHHN